MVIFRSSLLRINFSKNKQKNNQAAPAKKLNDRKLNLKLLKLNRVFSSIKKNTVF